MPAASAFNSEAGGIWTLRDAERLKRAGTWPIVFSSPTQISGLQLWLDASDASTLYDATTGGSLVAADGGVARWEDKSGNGRHATQGTSASRPVRKTNIFNGLSALRFDGSNDFLSLTYSQPVPCTAFCVVIRRSGGSVDYQSALVLVGPNQQFGVTINAKAIGSSNWGVYINNWHASGYSVLNNLSVLTQVSPTSGSETLETNLNSETVAFASRYAGDAADRRFIGADHGNSGGYLSGDVCECLVYSGTLAQAQRAGIQGYLISKWGIS